MKKVQRFVVREIGVGQFAIDYAYPEHESPPLLRTGESMSEQQVRARLKEMDVPLDTIDELVIEAKKQNLPPEDNDEKP